VEEFESQATTMTEMEKQVKAYEAAGKHEAAARLQEQMVLIEVRFYRFCIFVKDTGLIL
jgi:hypothetical protein